MRSLCAMLFGAIFIVGVGCVVGCSRDEKVEAKPAGAADIPSQRKSTATAPSSSESRQSQKVVQVVATRKNFSDSYAMLKAQADAGDVDAAYQLSQDISRCVLAKDRQEVLETLAAQGQVSVADVTKQVTQDRAFCAGLNDEQLGALEYWVTRAARLGHTQAQLQYFAIATAKYDTPEKIAANFDEIGRIRAEALTHLTAAASKGDPTALFTLANYYQKGTLSKRDPVKAYAYMRLLQREGSVQSAGEILDKWRREMAPDEIRNAEAMVARKMGQGK